MNTMCSGLSIGEVFQNCQKSMKGVKKSGAPIPVKTESHVLSVLEAIQPLSRVFPEVEEAEKMVHVCGISRKLL